jgi:hypothetical protein
VGEKAKESEALRARRLQAARKARRLAKADLFEHLMRVRPDLTAEQIRQALEEHGEY